MLLEEGGSGNGSAESSAWGGDGAWSLAATTRQEIPLRLAAWSAVRTRVRKALRHHSARLLEDQAQIAAGAQTGADVGTAPDPTFAVLRDAR